ncbi:TrmH family RNA methyltransferase [Mesoterricola silvestris]|uniref:tRNA/rRNA methyltransferase n=1 Tax=Mesoterricola silvestris TaxID=2927979 RepID=A0AA48K7X3_9BACT|nr:RNA methyltransferase [Mesoterricola silvestris]BDU71616.1 tRNA/rRNA methyltransferase [Mesoterricola silvestris]
MTLPDPWPLFQDLRFAGQRNHPRGACFVAEGRILVEDLLAWGRAGRVEVVAVLAETASAEAVRPLLPEGAELIVASPAEVEALAGFPFHRGLMAAAKVPAQPGDAELLACRRLLALPNITDAENLGQLLRTAAALGLDGILLGPGPDPFSRRVVRVSMGTAWKLPLWRRADVWEALEAWRGADGEIVAAALGGASVHAWRPAARTALVLGPEGPGLSPEDLARCGRAVSIAMAPGVDSLNVAAAGAILMHRMVGP